MFIDVSKLEKILKEDYKSWGVEIGLTEDGMYIVNGTGWIIEADESSITKEFLGTLIKICGPAPKRGEFILYQKGEECPQAPLVHEDWFICHNDELAVGLCFTVPDYKPELEVLRLLSGVKFYWNETDSYRLG